MKSIFPVISNLESKDRRLNIIHSLPFQTNNARAGAHTSVLRTDPGVGMSCGGNLLDSEMLSLSNMSWLLETREVLASVSSSRGCWFNSSICGKGRVQYRGAGRKTQEGLLGLTQDCLYLASCPILFFTGKENSVKQKEKCHYLFVYKFWF